LNEIGAERPKPPVAFAGGYCDERWASDMRGYCWAWAGTKTIEALEEAGLKRTGGPTPNAASSDLQRGDKG
jgi:hypothetical protein